MKQEQNWRLLYTDLTQANLLWSKDKIDPTLDWPNTSKSHVKQHLLYIDNVFPHELVAQAPRGPPYLQWERACVLGRDAPGGEEAATVHLEPVLKHQVLGSGQSRAVAGLGGVTAPAHVTACPDQAFCQRLENILVLGRLHKTNGSHYIDWIHALGRNFTIFRLQHKRFYGLKEFEDKNSSHLFWFFVHIVLSTTISTKIINWEFYMSSYFVIGIRIKNWLLQNKQNYLIFFLSFNSLFPIKFIYSKRLKRPYRGPCHVKPIRWNNSVTQCFKHLLSVLTRLQSDVGQFELTKLNKEPNKWFPLHWLNSRTW